MKGKCPLTVKILLVPAVVFLFVGIFGLLLINRVYYGPSPAARDLLVSSVMETNMGQFIARWFLPEETIETIRSGEGVYDYDEIRQNAPADISVASAEIIESVPEEDKDKIEIVEVRGSTYRGKMLIVSDPSRVTVATSYPFDESTKGLKLVDMAKQNDALAAINGGGFTNVAGDKPQGIAISGSEILCGEAGKEYNVVGFTKDDVFYAGRLTFEEIVEKDFRDAVSFSPVLIKNGAANDISRYSSGLNPRTAIGQRADGAVLLLVVDGRQPHSLGANYQDLIEIMFEFGAVNAANLDGGSSSILVWENEIITNCCSLYGPGRIPTGFIVK